MCAREVKRNRKRVKGKGKDKGKMLENGEQGQKLELGWTGERYLPFADLKINGVEIHYELLHRYYFAFGAQFVKGEIVLDFASGEIVWSRCK